jgi:CheY-like chemotaxis protein
MNSKEIDLNVAIAGQDKFIRRTLGGNIELKTDFFTKPLKVHLDESMLSQVLTGLVENSRKMMPGGGTVHLQTEIIEVDDIHARVQPGARRGEFVRLTITDDGLGANREALREMFQQVSAPGENQNNQTLGLALINGLIKRRNGWIEAVSQEGSGTRICIYLPVASAANAEMLESGWIGETILLVDDEAAIRRMVKTVLERASYNVIEADNGLEALAVWEKNRSRVNVLLTDMVMPEGLNGRELASRLRTAKPNLNVIYTSGFDLAEEAKQDTRDGVIRFLRKPYDMRKLLEVIHETMTSPAKPKAHTPSLPA